jgi:hypothetical protein
MFLCNVAAAEELLDGKVDWTAKVGHLRLLPLLPFEIQ